MTIHYLEDGGKTNGVNILGWEKLGFVLLIAVANVLGGIVVLIKKNWSERAMNALMAVSAGLLLSITIVDLIPQVIAEEPISPIFVLAGIMIMFFFQQFVSPHFHFGEETHRNGNKKSTAFGAFFGMLIHTFFEGLAIVVSSELHIHLGLTVLIAVLLHKIPEGLMISSIVFAMSQDKKKAIGAVLILGISTLAGGGTALLLTGFPSLPYEQMVALVISFIAGIFLYVAGTNLLPVVNSAEDRPISLFFFLGILFYFLLQWGFELLNPALHHH
jgi:zinc transporter ZupT